MTYRKQTANGRINTTLWVTTLNINGSVTQLKSRDWQNGFLKKGPTICYLQKTYFRFKDRSELQIKLWKKDIPGRYTQESWSGYTYVRLNRLKDKKNLLETEEDIKNENNVNPSGRYNDYKHFCI